MKRLLQLFPIFILTSFMWGIGVSFNASEDIVVSQEEFQQKYTASDFSHFHTVEVEEGEFVIIESEPEFEVELDWFSIPTKSFNILQSSLKENSSSHLATFFLQKKLFHFTIYIVIGSFIFLNTQLLFFTSFI